MFGLNQNKPKKPRDLEQVIYDLAEYKREADFLILYDLLKNREMYMPIDRKTIPPSAKPGTPYNTTSSDHLRAKMVTGPNRQPLTHVATEATSPILKDGFVGIKWIDFLNMTLKVPQASGTLLQGKNSWVVFDKARIRSVLKRYGVANRKP